MFKKLQQPKFKVLNIFYKQNLVLLSGISPVKYLEKIFALMVLVRQLLKMEKLKHLDFGILKNFYTQVPILEKSLKNS